MSLDYVRGFFTLFAFRGIVDGVKKKQICILPVPDSFSAGALRRTESPAAVRAL